LYVGVQCDTSGRLISFNTGGTVTRVTSEDFLSRGGGSYRWNTVIPDRTISFLLYDITDLDITRPLMSTIYISFQTGTKKNGTSDIDWEHDQFISRSGNNSRILNYEGRTYIKIVGFASASNNRTFYFDDIGISKPNPTVSAFGKYDFSSGTSMATPVVAGSVALLATAYPNDNIHQRKARIMKSVTKKSTLSEKCATGGVLNLRNASSYNVPAPRSIKLSAKSKKVKPKKSITIKASVSPIDTSNRSVKWKVNNTKFAKINSKGKLTAKKKGAGKKVTVTAISKGKGSVKKTMKVTIRKK
jgi:subtilisin family serine protease